MLIRHDRRPYSQQPEPPVSRARPTKRSACCLDDHAGLFLAVCFALLSLFGLVVWLLVVRAQKQEAEVAVRSLQADLVVMGKQGRSRIRELFLGSVTRKVIATVDCDVLVAPLS